MNVRITRLDPSVPLPRYQSPGAAGFDLAAARDTAVPPRSVRLIPTGLVIETPAGHLLAIFIRSSVPIRKGLILANGVGVVDPDYSGPQDEIQVEVLNPTDEPVVVKKGERIAQGIFLQAQRVEWEEAGAQGPSRGGFGSTGT